jgi:membrane fusion protein (multidrug efflux system)
MSDSEPAAGAPPPPANRSFSARARPRARRRALGSIAGMVAVAALAYAVYWFVALRHYESTDNAYVQGNVVQITPQIGGTVIAIDADETERVKAGATLVRLDPADADVALEQAAAALAQTVREVRNLYASNDTLASQVTVREGEVARAQAELARARADVRRRAPLVASGAVSDEEAAHASTQVAAARAALESAQSALAAARDQLAAAQTMTEGVAIAQHPNVLRAAARVHEAYLARRRIDLPAPIDGVIAKRSVQVGQRVQAGMPLMTMVALDSLWVDANFKESQLGRIRAGQPVTLQADVYGSKVEFHGKVEGLGAGTGAAFALLPAQNATGNWIKIVQRVPVRIALERKELVAHPLRVGLSMEVSVDVADASGPALAPAPRREPVAQTTVFDRSAREADEIVRRIIAANLGTRAAGPARRR